MKETVLWCIAAGAGAFLLWGVWRLFRLVLRARGLDVERIEQEQRELRDSARYPRDRR